MTGTLDTRQETCCCCTTTICSRFKQETSKQEETKTKVKQTRDQTVKGERYHKVLGQCAVVCNLETVMAGIVMIITKA